MDPVRLHKAFKRRLAGPALRRLRPEVDVDTRVGPLRVSLRNSVVGDLLFVDGDYERELGRLISLTSVRGGVCVDVGANIGLHTVWMAREVGPEGTVFAFEPAPDNLRLLRHNVARLAAGNVRILDAAVGDAPGEAMFHLSEVNDGDHRVAAHRALGERGVPVRMTTLDDALADVPAGAVRFVKIDVQGFETQVLRGMQAVLDRNPDAVIALEIFPAALREAGSSATELVALMRALGLDGWEFHPHRVLPLQAPHVYELIDDTKDVNVVVSRGRKLDDLVRAAVGV